MWAVWFISMDQRLYIALVGFRPDDPVSASLFVRLSVSDETRSTQTETSIRISLLVEMCRGSNVKDSGASRFQLESLILAQNERWRQA